MKPLNILIVLAGLGASAAARADDSPPSLTIRNIIYGGTGCVAGSVGQNISPDRKAFTLLFDSFSASQGAGIPITEKRKACQINIDFDYPQGWSFGLINLNIRGYASLDPGVSALQMTSFYFQGSTLTGQIPSPVTGPYDSDYQVDNTVPFANIDWSDCNAHRSLNIKTQVRLSGFGNGLITQDSLDGALAEVYGIEWRRCN